MLVLDSNVIIDLVNDGANEVRDAFRRAKQIGSEVRTSPLAVHETVYGALISARPMQQSEAIQQVVAQLDVAALDDADALAAAQIRADLRRRGHVMSVIDALISGQALVRGWTLVTADDVFTLIPGLEVVNWRSQPAPQD